MKRTLALLLIALHAPLAAAVYRCVDEQGHTRFGDTPPSGCGNVPIYELSPSGYVIRRIDPTPTPQQLEQRREEQERLKKEALVAAEQKRKDMALLNTYDSADEFDIARDRNIEPVKGRIQATQERLKELDQREKQIVGQMEKYKDHPPAWLTSNLAQTRDEKKSLTDAMAHYHQEIADLRLRYDSDKKRWIALKAAGGSLPPPDASAPAAQAVPVKTAPARRRLGS